MGPSGSGWWFNLLVQSAETQFQNHPLQIDQRFQSIPIEDSDSEACQTGCSFSAADREFHAVSSPVSSWNHLIQASDEASVSHPQSSCEYTLHFVNAGWLSPQWANPATPLNPYQHLHHHPVPSSSKQHDGCSILLSDGLGRFLLVQNPLDGQGQRKFCCLSSWVKMSQLVSSWIAALIAILPAAPSSSSSWQPYPEASSNHPGVASISLDIITSSTLDTPDSWLNYTRIVKAEQAWDPDANSNLDLTSTSINPTSALRVENQMLFTFTLKALLSVVVENSEALLGSL